MFEAGFLFVDFSDLFDEQSLEEERLLADAHNFCVVSDHFNGTLVTVQSVFTLFLLEGRLFEMMVDASTLINLLLLQVFLDHFFRKHNDLLFAALAMGLLSFEMLFAPAEGRQSIGQHLLAGMFVAGHVTDSVFLLLHGLGYSFLEADVSLKGFLVLSER